MNIINIVRAIFYDADLAVLHNEKSVDTARRTLAPIKVKLVIDEIDEGRCRITYGSNCGDRSEVE